MRTSQPSAPTLEQVFTALDDGGVRWSVLRGGADLENLERDVDLLVAADDLPAFEEAVAGLGGVPLPQWLQGWHRFYWFRPPALTRPGLTLDVVTALIYGRDGRLPTDLAAGCLQRRVRAGTTYALAPTDTFWTVMLHCLLDKGEVKERRTRELVAALPGLVRLSDGEALVAEVCPEGWSPDRLVECVRQGDWDSINGLAAAVSSGTPAAYAAPKRETGGEESGTIHSAKRHLPQRNSLGGNVAKAAYAAAWKLARRAQSGPGGATRMRGKSMSETETTAETAAGGRGTGRRTPFRISLSGLDGSGKSRQTAALAAVRVHLGPRGRMDADAHLTAAQLAERASQPEAKAPQPHRSTKLLPKMFWWTVASLAAVSAGASLRRRMNRMTAEVIVIDRYRLDTIVKLQTWYPAVSPTWLARIVLRLAPAPDVECLLRVEGAEAYARKPEQYNAVQLTNQARRYDELVATVPGAVVVDGQELPDDVTLALKRLADAALHAR
jgi:thymidylate kinase